MSDSSFVAVDFDSFLAFVNDSCIEAAANDPDYVGAEGDDYAADADCVSDDDGGYADYDGTDYVGA